MSFQTHETIQRLWETFLREQLDRLPPEERQAYEVQFEQRLGDLLDESVVVDNAEAFKAKQFDAEYKIVQRGRSWDLSQVNVDQLREEFNQAPFKNIQIADLRAFLEHKLAQMLAQNATRSDFAQRLQNVIDAYNSGATATESYYDELTAYAEALKAEAERSGKREVE